MLCHWVSSFSLFQRSQCLHFLGEAVMILKPLGPKDEGTTILPNMENCLPSDTANHRRILNHQQHCCVDIKFCT